MPVIECLCCNVKPATAAQIGGYARRSRAGRYLGGSVYVEMHEYQFPVGVDDVR
jgi:hypothetical protein